jgi:hypothetical protein
MERKKERKEEKMNDDVSFALERERERESWYWYLSITLIAKIIV